jgi:hypothetical protein
MTAISTWRDRRPLGGTDGNHYGFYLQNTILTHLESLRSYGGGGLKMLNNSAIYEYGNLDVQDFYAATYIGGSADAIVCDGVSGAGVSQVVPLHSGYDSLAVSG